MKTAHLFAGAGGGLLADIILGHNPVLAVEWDEYCCQVLRGRAADGWFPGLYVHRGDIRDFDFSPWCGRVDCIAAGFPCQDISVAGGGAGINGKRSGLVWEIFRAIDAIRPPFVFLENSPNIRTKGRREIITALVARGYSYRDGTLAASDVGAGHRRKRWWLLAADADGLRQLQQINGVVIEEIADIDCKHDNMGGFRAGAIPQHKKARLPTCKENAAYHCGKRGIQSAKERQTKKAGRRIGYCIKDAADTLRHRLKISIQREGLSEADANAIETAAGYTNTYRWSPPDAGVCRVVDGMADRIHRIKALGNGQVPLQAAAAWIILGEGI